MATFIKNSIRLFMIIVTSTISSCKNERLNENERLISNFLENSIQNQDSILVLDTISTFNWDELIIVGPYMPLERIDKETDYDLENLPTSIEHHDHFILFGFLEDQKAVSFIELSRKYFTNDVFIKDNKDYRIYSRNEAQIKLRENRNDN